MDLRPPIECRLSANVWAERYGTVLLVTCFAVVVLIEAWRPFLEGARFSGMELLLTFGVIAVGIGALHTSRSLHDVYLRGSALRVIGPHVNATVPLAFVRYVELLPIGRGRRRIVITFDRRAGVGESIEFIPAGIPLFGGGENAAAELAQLVKNAHAADLADSQSHAGRE